MKQRIPPTGRIEEHPVYRLLADMASHRVTGILTVSGETDTVDVMISEGYCVGAVSHYPRESLKLGRLMVLRGYCTDAQVEELLTRQENDLLLLGRLACDAEYLSEAELSRVLEDQFLLVLYQCMTWTRGVYYIQEKETIPYDRRTLRPIDLKPVFRAGPKIVKGRSWLQERIPDEELVPERVPGREVVPEGVQVEHDSGDGTPFVMTRDQERVVHFIDGMRTIREICDAVHMFKWSALSALIDLQDAGIITWPEKVRPRKMKKKPADAVPEETSRRRISLPDIDLSKVLVTAAKGLAVVAGIALFIVVLQKLPEKPKVSDVSATVDMPFPRARSQTALNTREIQMALVTFHLFEDSYPETLDTLLDRSLIQDSVTRDGWMNQFEYRKMDEGYYLRSFGADRIPDTDDDLTVTGRASDHVFGCFFPGTPDTTDETQTLTEGETS